MISNNVTRLLDSKKINYTPFEIPAEKLGAEETAQIIGIDPSLVFKTIVIVRPKGKPLLCVIPGNLKVDLKKVSIAIDEKKVTIPTQNEAEKITGLQAGGISPIALINKGFQIVLDSAILEHEAIHISGGQRGLIIKLHPSDLQKLTNATIISITSM